MKSITFEKRDSPVYPAYMRVDDYCIHLEPELIQSLKEITQIGDHGRFLSLVTDQVGTNTYLRGMIEKNIAKASNRPALVLKLRNSINNL